MATAKAVKNKSETIAGIVITHPDRVISETRHITKGQLAAYYAAIAPLLLPRIVRRP
jgi:bifunctional non-homologous end joining protein LigD